MVRCVSKSVFKPTSRSSGSAESELNPVTSARRVATDVVIRTSGSTRPAFDAVARADQRPLTRGVPEIDACRAEVVAVLALTQLTRVLVRDFDMGSTRVFLVMDGRQLVWDVRQSLRRVNRRSRQWAEDGR